MPYWLILITVSIILNIAIRLSKDRPMQNFFKVLLYISPITVCLFLLSHYAEAADLDKTNDYRITFAIAIAIFALQVFIDYLNYFVSEDPYM